MEFIFTEEQNKILNQLETNLQANKIRLTKVRREILRIILANYHPTFNDIVEHLEQQTKEKPNIMSVYNTINMLLANDVIYANTFDGRQISYEIKIAQSGHLKCDNCLQVIHLSRLEQFEKDFEKLANYYHWTADHFKLEIHGLCPKCQRENTR